MEIITSEFREHLIEVASQAGEAAALRVLGEKVPKSSVKKRVPVKELSRITGISIPTLIRRRNDGTIKGYRFGGKVFYDVDEVLESMQSTKRA